MHFILRVMALTACTLALCGRSAAGQQEVDGALLCAAALAHLRSAVDQLPEVGRFEARCEEGIPSMVAPTGPLSLSAPGAPVVLNGLQSVAVRVEVDGRAARTARIPVRVTLELLQWCARDALPSGSEIVAGRFERCTRPALRADQLPLAGHPLPQGRLYRALKAGDVLSARDVAPQDMHLAGEPVTVVWRAGALMVESRGALGQDAGIGEPVRVRVAGGQWLLGRLVAGRRVEIEEQP